MAAKDNSGFIVNLLLVPYLLDAIRALEHGVASTVDIDNAMKLGCGYPMGPLTLLDFVGNDTTYKIAEIMFTEYRETRYAPPPLLKRMVMAGLYGRKSGKGFYDYATTDADPGGPRPLGILQLERLPKDPCCFPCCSTATPPPTGFFGYDAPALPRHVQRLPAGAPGGRRPLRARLPLHQAREPAAARRTGRSSSAR